MAGRKLDPVAFSMELYERVKPSLGFKAKSRFEAEYWRRQLKEKLIELLGGFPRGRCNLDAEVTDRVEFPNYVRESVYFQSMENLTVFGYFLIPKGIKTPAPAILCLHGHGRGCDEIVGIEEDGSQRKEYGGYQKDFAIQAVDHGYVAFAIEQLGFGRRRDEKAKKSGPGTSSCQPVSGAALLLGRTMIGWRVYDAMRAIDYMRKRKEVDPERIGCMGISGGGTTTFYTAALDERVKVAVVSGYFNTYRDSIMSISHCIDNYIPGILRYFEMYDIAGLIAPRAFFVESGTEDSIFPVEATKFAFEKARTIYRMLGAGDKIDMEIFEGEHQFHGVKAFEFLKKWL